MFTKFYEKDKVDERNEQEAFRMVDVFCFINRNISSYELDTSILRVNKTIYQ